MTVAPLAPGIEALACALLLTRPTEHRRIQVQRAAPGRTTHAQQHPAPGRTPELLDVGLGEAEEEMADRVSTGKAGPAAPRVPHTVSAQPFGVGEPTRAHDDRQDKCGESMSQRAGVVGNGFGARQGLLHRLGEPNPAAERNETDPPAEGPDGLGRFLQNELGLTKEGGNFGAGRFVQGRLRVV